MKFIIEMMKENQKKWFGKMRMKQRVWEKSFSRTFIILITIFYFVFFLQIKLI
jgi:hypothetical protein